MSTTPPTPPKKDNHTRNGCLIAAGIIGGLIVLGGIIGPKTPTDGSTDTAASQPAADPAASAVRVTAAELINAYKANEVAAQGEYGDKPLLVTGRIKAIQLDFANDPLITLNGTDGFNFVNVTGLPTEAAGTLQAGQSLTVLCQDVTEVIGFPQVSDCTVQP